MLLHLHPENFTVFHRQPCVCYRDGIKPQTTDFLPMSQSHLIKCIELYTSYSRATCFSKDSCNCVDSPPILIRHVLYYIYIIHKIQLHVLVRTHVTAWIPRSGPGKP